QAPQTIAMAVPNPTTNQEQRPSPDAHPVATFGCKGWRGTTSSVNKQSRSRPGHPRNPQKLQHPALIGPPITVAQMTARSASGHLEGICAQATQSAKTAPSSTPGPRTLSLRNTLAPIIPGLAMDGILIPNGSTTVPSYPDSATFGGCSVVSCRLALISS